MLQRLFGAPSVPEVSVEEARRRQAQGALIVDVREAHEWAGGHVPGARHVPLSDFGARAASLSADKELLVICRSGNRSARAVAALQRAGFDKASNVAGGMLAWARAGLPVSR